MIKDYTYEKKITYKDGNTNKYDMITTITMTNGEKISVSCPEADADQYSGFAIAYATICAGGRDRFNKMADYAINKIPAKKEKEAADKAKRLEKAKADEIKQTEKRRKNRIKREAKRRKESYEVMVLANHKYGVPFDFEPENADK